MSLPILQIKRRNDSFVNWPNGLIEGELGYNYDDETLWIGPYGDTDGKGDSILLNTDRRITAANWKTGTVSGPSLEFTEGDQLGYLRDFSSAAIPAASDTKSGVVVLGSQTFAGPKKFVKYNNAGGITLEACPLDVQDNTGSSQLFAGPDGVKVKNLQWTQFATGGQSPAEDTLPSHIAHFDNSGNMQWVSPANLVAIGISAGAGLTQDANVVKHINSISAGTIAGSTSTGLSFGDTINIPSITYDNTGHISSTTTTSVKLPTISTKSSNVSTATAFVTGITLSATGELTTTKFNGNLGGNDTFVYFNEGVPTAATGTIGSGTKPIYMSSGILTASASTVGSKSLPVYMNSGEITACTASSVFSALSWTGDTTAGPTLKVTVAGQERTTVIPSANTNASGVITTGNQSFSGIKTFSTGIAIPVVTSDPANPTIGQIWINTST